ncbi:hypothetical protein AB0B10_25335 [Micromonospora arborensis]|uniref:hypothetical protein n=1 Tax=Micromonospora arborensis TaxID=2116518 RepID=UPI0033D3C1B5
MLSSYVPLAVWLTRAELGDVATWVGALANVATLAFALVAALVGFRVYKIESGRDRRAEDERRERALDEKRNQASLVSAWLAEEPTPALMESPFITTLLRQPRSWAGYVLNASNVPIYDVLVHFRWADTRHVRTAANDVRVVPPHQDGVWISLPEGWREQIAAEPDPQHVVDVAVEFRDAAGRYWRRDWDGALTEAPNHPA